MLPAPRKAMVRSIISWTPGRVGVASHLAATASAADWTVGEARGASSPAACTVARAVSGALEEEPAQGLSFRASARGGGAPRPRGAASARGCWKRAMARTAAAGARVGVPHQGRQGVQGARVPEQREVLDGDDADLLRGGLVGPQQAAQERGVRARRARGRGGRERGAAAWACAVAATLPAWGCLGCGGCGTRRGSVSGRVAAGCGEGQPAG